ncbi:MAG: type II secretion system protein [Deltaproteobacteria bacterium]
MIIKEQKGFTLIELVMVIVILAILAAVAVPRFIDLQTDAKKSTAKGVAGAIAGSANILHAQYLLKNTAYAIGTTGGPNTGILYSSNIEGADVVADLTTLVTGDATVGIITITVGGDAYTMNLTMGSSSNGPRVKYNF